MLVLIASEVPLGEVLQFVEALRASLKVNWAPSMEKPLFWRPCNSSEYWIRLTTKVFKGLPYLIGVGQKLAPQDPRPMAHGCTTPVRFGCQQFLHWQAEQTIGGSNGFVPSAAPVVLPAALGCPGMYPSYVHKAEADMVPSDNGTAEVGIRGSNSRPQVHQPKGYCNR